MPLRAGGREQYWASALHTYCVLPALQKWQLGFSVLFVSFGPEFAPNAYTQSYFQSYIISLYFVSPGEVCPDVSFAAL